MPASSQTSPTSGMRVDTLAALLAGDRHPVDPRAAQLLELVEALECALLELGLRADHVQVPARARVERQRQAVVAAPRDVPVAHVAQPVVHALAHVLGHPFDRGVRREQLRTQLVDRDEPVVGDAPDQRRVAAPAMRIAVRRTGRPRRGTRSRRGGRRSGPPPPPSSGHAASRSRRRSGLTSSTGVSTGRSCTRDSSKSSGPQPGAMWTMPVPSSSDTSSQGITRCSTVPPGARSSNGPR